MWCTSHRLVVDHRPYRPRGQLLWRCLIVEFWEDSVVLRLFHNPPQQFNHTIVLCYHQSDLSLRQMMVVSRQLDASVTFLCDCSRDGGRGRSMTCADSRFSWVWDSRASERCLPSDEMSMERNCWGWHRDESSSWEVPWVLSLLRCVVLTVGGEKYKFLSGHEDFLCSNQKTRTLRYSGKNAVFDPSYLLQ